MAFADIEAKLTISGFSAGQAATIKAAIKTAYDGSATAKGMFDGWVATAGNTLKVDFGAGLFRGFLNTGRIEIDLAELTKASYIDNNGKAVEDTAVTSIVHEFVHAITGKRDNWNNTTEYKGDTVKQSNIIYKELGLPEQNSYIAYDTTGNIITRGFNYTNGTAIDKSESGDRDWNSSAAGNSADLLIGGASGNSLQSGDGNDFLFGAGGNDTLDGGAGTDTIVLTGKPVDYDVRLNADGTWTARHVRGAANEGTDTILNSEKIQFEGGQTFNLTKSGLTYQTDFSFVIDTTGSMFDDIDAVKASATGVINALFAGNTVDARVNVVTFKDSAIGEPTLVNLTFTDQDNFADRKTAALNAINGISVGGGGDFPETAFDGLLKALNGSAGDWRVGAGVKKVALFTDATAKDVGLLPTVLAYATNIGAVISSRSTSALGTIGTVDTFELKFDGHGRSPQSEGDDVTSQPLGPTSPSMPGGTAIVQVTTIFISGFTTPDPSLAELSEGTGGSVLLAANPAEVVERLLEVITTPTYSISVSAPSVLEGDSGFAEVTFTVARDRGDTAAVVNLTKGGTADASDILGSIASSVSFGVGDLSKTITVSIKGDTVIEADETLSISIGAIDTPSNVATSTATLTILNDDADVGGELLRLIGNGDGNSLTGTSARELIVGNRGDDIMIGGGGGDVFVFSWSDGKGTDRIRDFSSDDFLLTTSKIFDGNNDGIIGFSRNGFLDLPGGNRVWMTDDSGGRVKGLEYDGVYHDDASGVDYFAYSLIGSTADLSTIPGIGVI